GPSGLVRGHLPPAGQRHSPRRLARALAPWVGRPEAQAGGKSDSARGPDSVPTAEGLPPKRLTAFVPYALVKEQEKPRGVQGEVRRREGQNMTPEGWDACAWPSWPTPWRRRGVRPRPSCARVAA